MNNRNVLKECLATKFLFLKVAGLRMGHETSCKDLFFWTYVAVLADKGLKIGHDPLISPSFQIYYSPMNSQIDVI